MARPAHAAACGVSTHMGQSPCPGWPRWRGGRRQNRELGAAREVEGAQTRLGLPTGWPERQYSSPCRWGGVEAAEVVVRWCFGGGGGSPMVRGLQWKRCCHWGAGRWRAPLWGCGQGQGATRMAIDGARVVDNNGGERRSPAALAWMGRKGRGAPRTAEAIRDQRCGEGLEEQL
jgi:hypothetical protein